MSEPGNAQGAGAGHPGMMGDGTEEQNLDQKGNPKARITKDEVDEAFGGDLSAEGDPDSDEEFDGDEEPGTEVAALGPDFWKGFFCGMAALSAAMWLIGRPSRR